MVRVRLIVMVSDGVVDLRRHPQLTNPYPKHIHKRVPEKPVEIGGLTRGQDYKRFSSMSRCSTHNLCSEMT